MDPSQPPAPVTEMEQLFEKLRSGLGAEWVALEPDDAALGAGDDPRLLRDLPILVCLAGWAACAAVILAVT